MFHRRGFLGVLAGAAFSVLGGVFSPVLPGEVERKLVGKRPMQILYGDVEAPFLRQFAFFPVGPPSPRLTGISEEL